MSHATIERPATGTTKRAPRLAPARRADLVSATSKKVAKAAQVAAVTEANLDEINLDLQRVQGVLWMLIRCAGGEVADDERPDDADIVCCIQFVNAALTRVYVANIDERLHGDFATAISAARGIASSLDAMTWADGMAVFGSDTVMSQLYDAIDSCVEEALAALAPLLYGDSQSRAAKSGSVSQPFSG